MLSSILIFPLTNYRYHLLSIYHTLEWKHFLWIILFNLHMNSLKLQINLGSCPLSVTWLVLKLDLIWLHVCTLNHYDCISLLWRVLLDPSSLMDSLYPYYLFPYTLIPLEVSDQESVHIRNNKTYVNKCGTLWQNSKCSISLVCCAQLNQGNWTFRYGCKRGRERCWRL
jgi:hypothetical protein